MAIAVAAVKNQPMRQIRLEKIVLNIGCGTKTNVENAKKILEMVSGSRCVITKTRRRNTFNVPKDTPIGCKVTIRKNRDEFLKKLLLAKENKLKQENFDSTGNFAFGVKEYIDVPGTEYDPKIGIIGFDVCISLERPGYSIRRRRIESKVGKKHLIKKEEAIAFVKDKFGVVVE